jgi:hypothetical protein
MELLVIHGYSVQPFGYMVRSTPHTGGEREILNSQLVEVRHEIDWDVELTALRQACHLLLVEYLGKTTEDL